MVLGLRTKSRKDRGVFVEYLISIKELKPWPTNLVPAQCVLLKWENGEHSSGTFIAVVGNDTIMFNESFRLTLTLDHKGPDKFQKNLLEFHVYDARRNDKTAKNKLLGSAAINLAEHGVVKGSVAVGAPFSFKKSSRNEANSVLYATIEPVHGDDDLDENNSSCSSPKTSFSRASVDKDGSEFDASLASCTDDDDASSSQSSRRVSFSANPETNPTTNASPKVNGDEKKGWKHVRLKHNTNEATLVSEIERLLREEEKKRQNNQLHVNSEATLNSRENEKQTRKEDKRNDADILEAKKQFPEFRPVPMLPLDAARKQMKLRTNTLALGRKTFGLEGVPKLKQLKSIQLHFDTDESHKKVKDESHKKATNGVPNKGGTAAQESRIETLEEELTEAAALEAAIYSVVAEHSSSVSKVHAPARRLSRFYLHACKASSDAKRANAARAAVSGLILVSKASGNDVPRLTFWLSNSIVLRTIVSQGVEKLNLSSGANIAPGGGEKKLKSFLEKDKNNLAESSDDWEDPCAFITALEKFEAWIFSRIVKSIWWQNLTPHMQSTAAKGLVSRKSSGKMQRSSHKNQGLYSIELWKGAFKAACERLCPLRGARQKCGCLSMLAKLVIEQLVSRLDVAMFNAILRESADEMPTDPVSDPISDINVLPIPAGKASFGAGAQLKNVTGTWSRWLADQFDRKDGDSNGNKNGISDEKNPECESFRVFHLLNALGDLMMLPFKMLADRSIRKEVCPLLGPLIIKRVLRNFVPDEFNPHRIPRRLFDILNSEDSPEVNNGSITSFPCAASPMVYSMPPVDSIKCFIGEFNNPSLSRTGSSLFKKAYTSDDELDDLDIAINSIFSTPTANNASKWMPARNRCRKAVRYQLLREIWRDGEL